MIFDYIQYGSRTIQFRLVYVNRKSLGITVTPDLEVLVKAPTHAKLEIIKDKIIKKAPWIIKQQSLFLSFQPITPQRRYVSGETHLYLGRQYRLKIIKAKLNPKSDVVKLKGQFIEVHTSDLSKVKMMVDNWYLSKAKAIIKPLAENLFNNFIKRNKLKVSSFQFSFRSMPTRWGSCTAKGKIIINPELIKAPKLCIEYVIIHELCHLIYHDHTQKFIELQTKHLKDWEKRKMKLERFMA
jgi:hypothetical protein